MAEAPDTDYLSIGEVLGLLLEEFPDVTISKIRFLESQGLIDPERTPSGYRKFYDPDVELLRVILREQRENYLPLRVIKDRLDAGLIDPSGEVAKPGPPGDGERSIAPTDALPVPGGGGEEVDESDESDESVDDEVPPSSLASHPASRRAGSPVSGRGGSPVGPASSSPASPAASETDEAPVVPQLLPGVVLDRDELCAMTGVTAAELAELESFGIVSGRGSGGSTLYGDDAVETARVAVEFLRSGVEARHLRGWRTAAEREASLYEQLITPRLRQRNPESRAEALAELRRLDALGAKLRSALVHHALRHHFEA